MVVINNCFHLNIVCHALDFYVQNGNIENELDRQRMAIASHLYKQYSKELEDMHNKRKALV